MQTVLFNAGLEAELCLINTVLQHTRKVELQVAAAYECAGYFNINNPCRSMPDLKGKAFVNYTN